MTLLNHVKNYIFWYLLLVVMLLGISAYYWFEWRTLANFIGSMDNNLEFMGDFLVYFYPMGQQILHGYTPVPGYYYTSFFALLLVPIGMLLPHSAIVVWGAIQFVCLAALCIISANLLHLSRPLGKLLCVGLYVTCFPVLHNINWGQVSILITLLVVAAFYAYAKNMRVLAGILLACAAAIKYYPLLFLVYFILKRDVRTCMAFIVAAFVFYFAFPATVLGIDKWLEFERIARTALLHKEVILGDVNSQYIASVGLRWIGVISSQDAADSAVKILSFLGYGIALSCIAMVWLLQQRPQCEKYGLPMVVIFLSIPFLIKTSWPHYFVYLPICQMAVFSYYAASFRTYGLSAKMLGSLPVLSISLSSIFMFNLFPDWIIYNSYGMLFLSNLLLLIAVYATIFFQPATLRADRGI